MIRPVVVYVFGAFILLSQVGLPVHLHYCKGMLESVSVFFNRGCDDHENIVDLPACCQKPTANHCSKEGSKCCDDQVKVVTQDITSLRPHFIQWVDAAAQVEPQQTSHSVITIIENSPFSLIYVGSDPGPPIYILHQSLIFYA